MFYIAAGRFGESIVHQLIFHYFKSWQLDIIVELLINALLLPILVFFIRFAHNASGVLSRIDSTSSKTAATSENSSILPSSGGSAVSTLSSALPYNEAIAAPNITSHSSVETKVKVTKSSNSTSTSVTASSKAKSASGVYTGLTPGINGTHTTPKSSHTSVKSSYFASQTSSNATVHGTGSSSKHGSKSTSKTSFSKSSSYNSTTKTTASHLSLITSTNTNSTTTKKMKTTTSHNVTTKASYTVWDGQTITQASCASSTLGQSAADYCRLLIGTVQLHYWPTGTAALNKTFPSTIYLSKYDITMTSPSVYFAINTMKATGLCGQQVGPTLKNFAVGYDITDVSTMQPFKNAKATTRMGPPRQLELSDLRTDCPKTTILPEDYFDYQGTNHLVKGEDSECNPILSWPTDLRHAAGDFWTKCGRHWGGKLGVFDPPVPVTACTGDAAECLYGSKKTSTAVMASTTSSNGPATALADQVSTTPATPSPTVAAGPSNTGNSDFLNFITSARSSLALSSSSASATHSTDGSGPAATGSAVSEPGLGHSAAPPQSTGEPDVQSTDQNDPQSGATSIVQDPPPQNSSPSPTVVAAVGSNTFSAVPASSGVILPDGFTASAGQVTTLADALSSPIVVSVGSSNLVVGSESYVLPTNAPVESKQTQPTTPVAIATLSGDSVISALPGASSVVVGTQIASIGGAAVTEGGNIVKLTPSGVEVGDTDNNAVSTYSIPAASPQSSMPVNVGIVNGQSISVAPASAQNPSIAVLGDQTISLGGLAATISGGVNVASLGSSGVVIQAPSGTITIPVPSGTPISTNIAVVNGQSISVAPVMGQSLSAAVVDGQSLSIGAPAATISGGYVVSLGSSGIVVQASGSTITTIAMAPEATNLANVGVINGQTVSIAAGSPSSPNTPIAVVAGHTLTAGGPVATLSGGEIASLGSSGVVVQAAGGTITTIPVPTYNAQPPASTFTSAAVVFGQTMTVSAIEGNSVAIIAGQTLTSGGPVATISGGNVVSLGVSGVVVQGSNGKATTIAMPMSAPDNKHASGSGQQASDNGQTSKTGDVKIPFSNQSAPTANILSNGTGSNPSSSPNPTATTVELFSNDGVVSHSPGIRWWSVLLLGICGSLVLR
ncbi:hypothetical protein CJF31_00000525 [Rutstroemia sp. NJR-2017a BVV2]|nr:hypothetical protein CJF31_00000525 [Rutstroemia sp. NJR-2017a BVV2]